MSRLGRFLFVCGVVSMLTVLAASEGWAQSGQRLSMPQVPRNPVSIEQCRAMHNEFLRIREIVNKEHGVCYDEMRRCHGTTRTAAECIAPCREIFRRTPRFGEGGDLTQAHRREMRACEAAVDAHEKQQRARRQAEADAQRDAARREADAQRDAARLAAEAQREYIDMQRRQSQFSAQQMEQQRQKAERLQELQRQQERQVQALSSALSSLFRPGTPSSGGSPASSGYERPPSGAGNIVYDTSRVANLAVRANEDIKSTVDIFKSIFSSDANVQRESQASLVGRLQSEASSAASSGVASLISAMIPRRNDYEDARFSSFFESTQNAAGLVPTHPGIKFIQETSGGVLKNMLQDTLGDLDQLQSDISNFSAGGSSFYSPGRSLPSQWSAGSGQFSSGVSREAFRPNPSLQASPPSEQELVREELELVRQGLRYGMAENKVFAPSLARMAGFDAVPTPTPTPTPVSVAPTPVAPAPVSVAPAPVKPTPVAPSPLAVTPLPLSLSLSLSPVAVTPVSSSPVSIAPVTLVNDAACEFSGPRKIKNGESVCDGDRLMTCQNGAFSIILEPFLCSTGWVEK